MDLWWFLERRTLLVRVVNDLAVKDDGKEKENSEWEAGSNT